MKKKIHKFYFLRIGNFRPFLSKNVQIWEHFFPLLFESLKILDASAQRADALKTKALQVLVTTSYPELTHALNKRTAQVRHPDILFYTNLSLAARWAIPEILTQIEQALFEKKSN